MSTFANPKLLLSALLFFTVMPLVTRSEPVTPTRSMQAYNRYLRAEEFLISADDARDNSRWREAGADYERALTLFAAFAADYPDWQPQLVHFRITYCREQAEAMSKRLALEAPSQETTAASPAATLKPDAAVEDDPTAAPADESPSFVDIARRALLAGQYNRSRDLLLRALRDAPESHELRLLIGTVQCASGQYEDAYYILSTLVEDRPDCPLTRNALAAAFLGMGQTARAIEELNRAVTADGALPDPHVNLAYALLLTGEREQASAHYRLSLTLGASVRPDLEERLPRSEEPLPFLPATDD